MSEALTYASKLASRRVVVSQSVIERAALASINSHRGRMGLRVLDTLDNVPNADVWRQDARVIIKVACKEIFGDLPVVVE